MLENDNELRIAEIKASAKITAYEIGKVVNVILGGTNNDDDDEPVIGNDPYADQNTQVM